MANRSDIILGVQNRTSAELRTIARDVRQTAQEATRAEREFQALERSINQLRDSEIRAARAAGDHQRALALIDNELGRAQQGTVRYNDLLARQATASKQAEGGTRSLGSAVGVLQQGLGALGIAFGAQQVVQFGISSFQAGQRIKQTQTTLQLLTRDQKLYNSTLDLAQRNQSLFGGSLADNLQPLTSLALQARKTGADIAQLNDIAQRLNVLSPEQGLQGAGIALREALSGDTTSLVERFELPRNELAKLRDTSLTTADRLKLLDGVLTSYGVSSQVVAGSVSDETKAVNDAKAAWDDFSITLGQAVAPAVGDTARGLERLLRLAQGSPEALAQVRVSLRSAFGGSGAGTQSDLDAARAGQRQQTRYGITDQLAYTAAGRDFTPARINQIADALTDATQAGGDFAQISNQLIQQYRTGAISAGEFANRSDLLAAAVANATHQTESSTPAYIAAEAASKAAAAATASQTTELGTQITALQEAKQKQDALTSAQAAIAEIAQSVVNGYASQEVALGRLIAQTGLARAEAERLLGIQIAIAAQAGAAQGLADQRAGERSGGQYRSQAEANAAAAAARAQADRQRALAQSQRDYAYATGTASDRLALLRRELAGLRKETPEYYQKLTEVKQAEAAVAAERQRSGKSAATAYSKEQRSAEQIAKARFDLLSTEEQLADLRKQVASGKLSELDRLEAVKQIKDLEAKISDEREKQTKSALDARLAALEDRKQRRIDERDLAAARRILSSGETSAEQKAAAQDAIERILLEQQKRQIEIAGKVRDAGGVAAAGSVPTVAGVPVAALPGQGVVALPSPVAALPTGAAGDITPQLLDALSRISFTAYIDGRPVAGSLVATLRGGFEAAKSGGTGKAL